MEITKNNKKETGLTYIIVGSLLLFYMLGILTRGFIIVIAAVYMIIKGVMISGYYKPLLKIIGMDKNK